MSSYDTTPPSVNLKCIVGTALLASGYWFLPSKNKFVLLSLCYFPYLAIAWYDYLYGCKHNFGPTYLAHFYSWAKPQSSSQIQIYKNWDPKIKRKVIFVDILVLIGILLLLPKLISWNPKPQEKQDNTFGYILFGVTLSVLVYLRFRY
jgi:hypothetical protein